MRRREAFSSVSPCSSRCRLLFSAPARLSTVAVGLRLAPASGRGGVCVAVASGHAPHGPAQRPGEPVGGDAPAGWRACERGGAGSGGDDAGSDEQDEAGSGWAEG